MPATNVNAVSTPVPVTPAPPPAVAPTRSPASGLASVLNNGPAKELHANLYNKVAGSSVKTLLMSALPGNLGNSASSAPSAQSAGQPDDVAKNYKDAKKGLGSAVLVGGTGVSLFAESGLHFSRAVNREAARAAIGYVQKSLGLAGMAYYGMKCKDHPEPHTALMALGYACFKGEGLARMWEASRKNLPVTGSFAVPAAFIKMTAAQSLLCTLAYFGDFLANTIEWRHGTKQPAQEGFARALWNLGHSMKREQIAAIQIASGLGMEGNAFGKLGKYFAAKDAFNQAGQPPAPAATSLADQQAEVFLNKLFSGDKALEQELEQVSTVCSNSPEEFDKRFAELIKKYGKIGPGIFADTTKAQAATAA